MTLINNEKKRTNVRTMKWLQMINNGIFSDKKLLIKRIRKGVPTSMRIAVWPQLIKIKKVIQNIEVSYSTTVIKDSMNIYDINLDIPRTFPFDGQQILRESLFNVLKALSILFPQIGYCQGMNFLTMRLLQIMNDDTVFYLLSYLIRKYKQIYDNFRNPAFVNRQNAVYKKLLKEFIPKVSSKLTQINLDPILYTPSWFLTLFSKSLSQETFYRFFEVFLVEGYCFVYKMILAIIKVKQKQILTNSMEQNFLFIQDMTYYHLINNDQLIQIASKYQFTNQQITMLEQEYNHKNKLQIDNIQKSCKQNTENKIGDNRIFQWTLSDFEEMRISLMKFDD